EIGTFNVAFTVADAASNTTTKIVPIRVVKPQILIDLPSPSSSADVIDRGFYVTNYPGLDLQAASLYFSTNTSGSYTFTLTARAGGYGGAVIGTATQTVSLTSGAAP